MLRLHAHSIPIYVTLHGKTNYIALGLNLRYEPKRSPTCSLIIIDFHFFVIVR